MMKKILILVALLTFLVASIQGAGTTEAPSDNCYNDFFFTYGKVPELEEDMEANGIAADADGIYSTGDGPYNVLMKHDFDGNLEYAYSFGGENDYSRRLSKVGDHIYVTGIASSVTTINYAIYVTKFLKSTGAILWSKFLDTNRAYSNTIVATSDYVYTAYHTENSPKYLKVAKLDATNGNIVWYKAYQYSAEPLDLALYEDHLYFSGTDGAINRGGMIFGKIAESDGSLIWLKHSSSTNEFGTSILVNSEGILMCGYVRDTAYHAYLAKFDHDGVEQWNKIWIDSSVDDAQMQFFSMTSDESGLYLAGASRAYSELSSDSSFVIKTDFDGNKIWASVLDSYYQINNAIAVYGDKLYVAGITYAYAPDADYSQYFILSMSANGVVGANGFPSIDGDFMTWSYVDPNESNYVVNFQDKTGIVVSDETLTVSASFTTTDVKSEILSVITSTDTGSYCPKNLNILSKDGFKETGWVDGFFVPFNDIDSSNRLFTTTHNDVDGNSQPSDGDYFQFHNDNGIALKCNALSCWFGGSVADSFEIEVISYDDSSDVTVCVLSKGSKYLSYSNYKFSMQSGRKEASVFRF